MFWLIVAAAAVVAVASVVVPVLIGRSVGKAQRIPDAHVTPVNQNLVSCNQFGRDWDDRRGDVCCADHAETEARNRADTLRTELGIALAVVGGFLAAAAAALVTSPVGWIAAIAFLAAATIAATAAAFIAGLLNAADEDLALKVRAAIDARTRLRDARSQLFDHCQPPELNDWLNSAPPSPC